MIDGRGTLFDAGGYAGPLVCAEGIHGEVGSIVDEGRGHGIVGPGVTGGDGEGDLVCPNNNGVAF